MLAHRASYDKKTLARQVIPLAPGYRTALSSRPGVVYKSRQPAKFAGFSVRFRRLLSLFEESRHVEEMMFMRSKLLGLNTNKNLQCLSFLKTHKRLLTQGQFKNVMLETFVLKKSCCGGGKVGTI